MGIENNNITTAKPVLYGAKRSAAKTAITQGSDNFVSNIDLSYETVKNILEKRFASLKKDLETKAETSWEKTAEKVSDFFKNSVADTKEYSEYMDFCDEISKMSKNSPLSKLASVIDDISQKNYLRFSMHTPDEGQISYGHNCVAIVTKQDESVAKDIFKLAEFDGKLVSLIVDGSQEADYKDMHRFDIKVIEHDSSKSLTEFQSAIFKALENSRKHFDKTGKKTIYYVEDIEKLLSPETNSARNIAGMKDMMQYCDEDCGAMLTFKVSDMNAIDPGTRAPHRILYHCNIDEMGITQEQIKEYQKHQEALKPIMDEAGKIYSEGTQERFNIEKEIKKAEEELEKQLYKAKKLCEDPEKNANSIKKILGIDLSQSTKVVDKETTTQLADDIVKEAAKQTIADDIKETASNIVNKDLITKLQEFAKTNKDPLAIAAAAIVAVVTGIIIHFKKLTKQDDSAKKQ